MPIVNYVDDRGEAHVTKVKVGTSLMRGAIVNGISGIEARCGGVMSCGTCQVVITGKWAEMLRPATEMELTILEMEGEPEENARLSCQIPMREELDGIVVTVANKNAAG